MRRALLLASVLFACRTPPPFAPARFVEPQECGADADCGPGRVCMVFDSYIGALSNYCVVPCSAANRTCPKDHVCILKQYDGATAPYCARDGRFDAGSGAFPGATGWDEAFWGSDAGR